MFEYKFVRCDVVFGKAGKVDPTSYETLVREHASQGWHLVQILIENPPIIPSEYVIIFERSNESL
jgi:Domain of unknown function (DUF4177)